MTVEDEQTLIAEARTGSITAFEKLYRIHSARVFGLCVRLSGNQADAQDATQETFIKAWHALSSFRGGSAFSTWLHRIAFNEAIGTKRRHSNEHRHLQLVKHEDRIEDGSSAHMDSEQLERAIRGLPGRAREALVLTKIYGYTHEEAAELMNVATGTCKAQVHRAMQLLRAAMAAGISAATTDPLEPRTAGGSDNE